MKDVHRTIFNCICSCIWWGGGVLTGSGLSYVKNKLTLNKCKNYFKKYNKSTKLFLDDLNHNDIYNEPVLYRYDTKNIVVDPLIPELYNLEKR